MLVTDKNKLREQSLDWKGSMKDLEKLVDDMGEVMEEANGIGISAIQIGQPVRVFIAGKDPHLFINPKIVTKSSFTKKDWEGCLSCPGAHVRVSRSHTITLKYDTVSEGIYYKDIKRKFTGFDARVVQHELDHLNGFLIIDRGKTYQE